MIIEFRIPLPITVSDFQVAQLAMVITAQEKVTGGGEGIVVLKNEPFDNTDGHMGLSEISKTPIPKVKGQYTLKKYVLSSMCPRVLKAMMPSDSLFLWEEAWNAHPYCLTVMTNGYFSMEKFKIAIESKYLQDKGTTENALNMDAHELKKREVYFIDVAKKGSSETLPADEDVTKYHSEKRNIGPLAPEWYKTMDPVMCCYKKSLTGTFKYFGLQTIVENVVRSQEIKVFTRTMRQLICQMDAWDGLTMEDIRRMEDEAKSKLDEMINQGEKKDIMKEASAEVNN
ncbi:hypothetical protein WA577_003034 [Blastocystis sp. JDR]